MDMERAKSRFVNYCSLSAKPGKRWKIALDAQGDLVKGTQKSIVAVIEDDISRWPEITDAMKAQLSAGWMKDKEEEWADHALELANAALSSQSQEVGSKKSTQDSVEDDKTAGKASSSFVDLTGTKPIAQSSSSDKLLNAKRSAIEGSGSRTTMNRASAKIYNTVAVPSRKRGHLPDKTSELPHALVTSILVKGSKMPDGQRHYVRLGDKVQLTETQFKAAALSLPSADKIEEPPDLDKPDKNKEAETFEGWCKQCLERWNETKKKYPNVPRNSRIRCPGPAMYSTKVKFTCWCCRESPPTNGTCSFSAAYLQKLDELNAAGSSKVEKREHEEDSSSEAQRKKKRVVMSSEDEEDEDGENDADTTITNRKGKETADSKTAFVEFITSMQDEMNGMKSAVARLQKKHKREADLGLLEERVGRLSYLLKDGKKRA
ncbi:hypothetical protein CALCODRAFT_508790 [Calocera cornea HHB12733]|uniref:Uncharacterized protein n=1 Tax=Calocera cornea HHB12733 TaxID=1353952 RepID=A0A165G1I0_9BASI|nr:hypothetical protein CALCODRAFT_508790 [Calocera cornea HHB12733]